MRILALSDYFEDYRENRASFRVRYQTALKMSEMGHEVHFVYPGSGMACKRVKIGQRLLKQKTPGLFPMRLRVGGFGLIDMITKSLIVLFGDYDVIHVTNGHRPSQFIPCLLGKYLKRAIIVDECWEWLGKGGYSENRKGLLGRFVGAYDRHLEFLLKRIFDHVIVISEALAERFSGRSQVTVLNGGAETEELTAYSMRESRHTNGLPMDYFIVGMSNVMPADHGDNKVFFEAMRCLVGRHKKLFLLATGSETEYLHEVSCEYGFKQRLISPGYVSFVEYNRYLSCCDTFVLPYPNNQLNRGRWPNRLGDYFSLSRPIITNPTGDIPRLFQAHQVGVLCDFSAEAFIRTVEGLINGVNQAEDYARDSRYVAEEVISFERRN